MSKRLVRGRNRMPDYWEWSCDLCGKTVHTNSQATKPPGWVPKGRMHGSPHDFCSPEHEAEYNDTKKPEEAAAPEEATSDA